MPEIKYKICYDGIKKEWSKMAKYPEKKFIILTKPELLINAGLSPDNVLFIVEDRAKVVNKYRELNYTVLQVADGNY